MGIRDFAYLEQFRLPAPRSCEPGELWAHLFQTVLEDALDSRWHSPLKTIITHGTLARRILNFLNNDFAKLSMMDCYRRLMECLSEGKIFFV